MLIKFLPFLVGSSINLEHLENPLTLQTIPTLHMFKKIPTSSTQVQIEVLGYKTCILQMPIVTPSYE